MDALIILDLLKGKNILHNCLDPRVLRSIFSDQIFLRTTFVWVPANDDISLNVVYLGIVQLDLKLHPKSGLNHHHHHPTTNFSATSRIARKLKFSTDTHNTNLIQLTNCHCDICPGYKYATYGDICPCQEYLSCY